jgi:L-threonylcarbamoyladenylate synthase
MEIIVNCKHEDVMRAAKSLRDGHLVAFPTETVYGLGADATNKEAVRRIYSVKGRPLGHPVIVHISSINVVNRWAEEIPEYARNLAAKFWPGPMTLILKRSELAKDFITGGQNFVGLRVPSNPLSIALLKEFELIGGLGIAAPSANRFGAISPTSAEAVMDELSKHLSSNDLILDDGICTIGIESTIIDCTQALPRILRPGGVKEEEISQLTELDQSRKNSISEIKAPGQLLSHYSPKAKVSIGELAGAGDGFLAFQEIPTPPGAIRLASPSSITEYAKEFYQALRSGDSLKLTRIVVVPPEDNGLGVAIRNRLEKMLF